MFSKEERQQKNTRRRRYDLSSIRVAFGIAQQLGERFAHPHIDQLFSPAMGRATPTRQKMGQAMLTRQRSAKWKRTRALLRQEEPRKPPLSPCAAPPRPPGSSASPAMPRLCSGGAVDGDAGVLLRRGSGKAAVVVHFVLRNGEIDGDQGCLRRIPRRSRGVRW